MSTLADTPETAQKETGFWAALFRWAENRPKMRALNALNEMSDEELARRGVTRHGEAMRIVGAYW